MTTSEQKLKVLIQTEISRQLRGQLLPLIQEIVVAAISSVMTENVRKMNIADGSTPAIPRAAAPSTSTAGKELLRRKYASMMEPTEIGSEFSSLSNSVVSVVAGNNPLLENILLETHHSMETEGGSVLDAANAAATTGADVSFLTRDYSALMGALQKKRG